MAKTATTFRNSHLQAVADALDNGYCRIYDGTVPANANTAITGQTTEMMTAPSLPNSSN